MEDSLALGAILAAPALIAIYVVWLRERKRWRRIRALNRLADRIAAECRSAAA